MYNNCKHFKGIIIVLGKCIYRSTYMPSPGICTIDKQLYHQSRSKGVNSYVGMLVVLGRICGPLYYN